MNITSYSVELIKDPFGIIAGRRFEFLLDLDVPEDDELYSENGLYVRVIYGVEEDKQELVKYDLHERSTGQYLDFDLEDSEVEQLASFCREHWSEGLE
ncbi:DUF6509 family protein [Paenibacillus sp. YYML68]|uniref:DUF6509 family protein n=1 Tax=Paenibacillus sp. YYML68 TaxID=2909250 RepID=UPI00249280E0|nr:DUF6509 family protein [Paenibacillus sp. YYML68]